MIKQIVRKSKRKKSSPLLQEFFNNGYIFLKNEISKEIVQNIKSTFNSSKWLKEKSMVFEEDGITPRSLFNIHNLQPNLIKKLVKDKLIAKKILGNSIYIYQSHINYKKPYQKGGEYWWHSDWTFWHLEDGMLEPEALSLIFFLDDVNSYNGAMQVIPGSHQFTYTNKLNRKSSSANINIRHNYSSSNEEECSSEGLLNKKDLKEIKHKPLTIKGSSGDLLIMDANLWHYSPENQSDKDRKLLFIILNSINNQPKHISRPDYLVERNAETFKI